MTIRSAKLSTLQQYLKFEEIQLNNTKKKLNELNELRKSLLNSLNVTADAIDSVNLERQLTRLDKSILDLQEEVKNLERSIDIKKAEIEKLGGAPHVPFNNDSDHPEESISVDRIKILRELNFGRFVAEQDDLLESCFVPNSALRDVVSGRSDLVLGTKGSGKSAIWIELQKNKERYLINETHILAATNPKGDPEFREVLAAIDKSEYPSEDDLRLSWRLYLFGQLWKVVQNSNLIWELPELVQVERKIEEFGILYKGSGSKQAFAFALAKARALKSLNLKWKEGVQFDFADEILNSTYSHISIPFNDLINQIDSCLVKHDKRVWIVLDRLDEIIIGDQGLENLVLKGLLLAYRDFSDLDNAKVKIFLRDDVYNRVTLLGHFPALTHVRSRATRPIFWSLEDLLHLVVERLIQNKSINELLELSSSSVSPEKRRDIFYALFPLKIDKGKSAEGFKWIVDRITDGNGVATPRDLLAVLDRARTIQLEKIERDGTLLTGTSLFDEESIRMAVKEIAKDNLETKIFAEYPELRASILQFKGAKADHNEDSLKETLGESYSRALIDRLQSIGFIYQRERKGHRVWTIPFFYSFALDVRRGAAFDIGEESEDEEI